MNEGPQHSSASLGEIVFLLSRSPLHRSRPIASIHQWVLPAIATGQFLLFREKQRPVSYVSWAHLDSEVEKRYILNNANLRSDQWNSGDRLWVIDFVAEKGFGQRIMSDLKHQLFPDSFARALRWREGSDTLKVQYFHGANLAAKAKHIPEAHRVNLNNVRP